MIEPRHFAPPWSVEEQEAVLRRAGAAIGGQPAHPHRQAAGAIALNVTVATGSNTRGACNTPK